MGALLELCDPGIEWGLRRRLIDPEIYWPHAGVNEYYARQREAWEDAPRTAPRGSAR